MPPTVSVLLFVLLALFLIVWVILNEFEQLSTGHIKEPFRLGHYKPAWGKGRHWASVIFRDFLKWSLILVLSLKCNPHKHLKYLGREFNHGHCLSHNFFLATALFMTSSSLCLSLQTRLLYIVVLWCQHQTDYNHDSRLHINLVPWLCLEFFILVPQRMSYVMNLQVSRFHPWLVS